MTQTLTLPTAYSNTMATLQGTLWPASLICGAAHPSQPHALTKMKSLTTNPV